MSKICLFIIALLLSFSCSVDGVGLGEIHVGNDTFFSPPMWIQGDWLGTYTLNGNNGSDSFKFTINNFIARGINYNERINVVSVKYFTPTVQISATNYSINLKAILYTEKYNFSRISESEMSCVFERGDNDNWNNRVIINYTLTRQ